MTTAALPLVQDAVVEIAPRRGWAPIQAREIWAFRELLMFLVWRDVKVRYKQTALGAAWAVIQPLMTMVVFSVFFGRLAKMPSDGVPYPLFSFAALVPWTFFAGGLTQSANSLVGSANLIKKVYFPRLIVPAATVLAEAMDFCIAFAVLLLLMLLYGVTPTANIVYLPGFVLLAVTTSLAVGLWLSALNVEFRDIRHMVPFITQFWLFATPIAYPSSLLSEPWRTVYGINPMVGVVEGFRWALLASPRPPLGMLAISALVSSTLLFGGVCYFRRMERTFADVV